MLNYASEVWGHANAKDIESIHTKFLRRILGVKKSVNTSTLYGEVGRLPLEEYRKINMLKYFIQIVKSNDNNIVKKVFNMLKHDANLGHTHNNQNWAFHIKTLLEHIGLAYVWISEDVTNVTISQIKQRITDMYIQKWQNDISNSRKLITYIQF